MITTDYIKTVQKATKIIQESYASRLKTQLEDRIDAKIESALINQQNLVEINQFDLNTELTENAIKVMNRLGEVRDFFESEQERSMDISVDADISVDSKLNVSYSDYSVAIAMITKVLNHDDMTLLTHLINIEKALKYVIEAYVTNGYHVTNKRYDGRVFDLVLPTI